MTNDLTRFALLQVRNPGDPARDDELRSFIARLEVHPEQVRQVDILTERLGDTTLQDTDVLLVGGSGEYSVIDPHPAVARFIAFVAEVALGGPPVFASCFGYQALAVGLGGEVIEDEDHAEVGSYDMTLTAEGARDELFSTLPATFVAQLGHKDRVSRLPEDVVPLAASPLCPYQAFRVPGRPVYATQFHPELSWRENQDRFRGYMGTYGKLFGEEEAIRKLESHRPGPEANALPRRFVELFVD